MTKVVEAIKNRIDYQIVTANKFYWFGRKAHLKPVKSKPGVSRIWVRVQCSPHVKDFSPSFLAETDYLPHQKGGGHGISEPFT